MTQRDNVIPFPRPPLPDHLGVQTSDGRLLVTCEDPTHIFATIPGRCQCGEHLWPGFEEDQTVRLYDWGKE